ncbi:unnamed protein product [Protopolystoma xenopodis]|uniref:PARP catalytic domain-containing protein n=1 Tax=Protopolystoma xenopodis TaxID=117903 RepID=A0A448WU08_9PLAT|nr:unnamed protein product [Protopolystoma xenopodis]
MINLWGKYVYGIGGGAGCPSHKSRSCYVCPRQMLLCRVALGRSFIQFNAMKVAHAPPGHHSIVGRPSAGGLNYAEYVIYRGEQAYPEYLIIYQLIPPDEVSATPPSFPCPTSSVNCTPPTSSAPVSAATSSQASVPAPVSISPILPPMLLQLNTSRIPLGSSSSSVSPQPFVNTSSEPDASDILLGPFTSPTNPSNPNDQDQQHAAANRSAPGGPGGHLIKSLICSP